MVHRFHRSETDILFFEDNNKTSYAIRLGLTKNHVYLLVLDKQDKDLYYVIQEIEYNPTAKLYIIKNPPSNPAIKRDDFNFIFWGKVNDILTKVLHTFIRLTKE